MTLVLCNKCNRTVDAKINKETMKVMCPSCLQEITGLNQFMVEAMKRNREYLAEGRASFAFPCKKCNVRKSGVVKADGSCVICSTCKEPMEVAPFMVLTMKNLGMFEGKTTQ